MFHLPLTGDAIKSVSKITTVKTVSHRRPIVSSNASINVNYQNSHPINDRRMWWVKSMRLRTKTMRANRVSYWHRCSGNINLILIHSSRFARFSPQVCHIVIYGVDYHSHITRTLLKSTGSSVRNTIRLVFYWVKQVHNLNLLWKSSKKR